MRTSVTAFVLGLAALSSMGAAQAEAPSAPTPNRSLHLAIALQGDQALLDIQAAMVESLPAQVRQQMNTALPLVLGSAGSLDGRASASAVDGSYSVAAY